jgi:hypothetical protein
MNFYNIELQRIDLTVDMAQRRQMLTNWLHIHGDRIGVNPTSREAQRRYLWQVHDMALRRLDKALRIADARDRAIEKFRHMESLYGVTGVHKVSADTVGINAERLEAKKISEEWEAWLVEHGE